MMQVERRKFSGTCSVPAWKETTWPRGGLQEAGSLLPRPEQRRLSFTEIAAPAEIEKRLCSFFICIATITDGVKSGFGVNRAKHIRLWLRSRRTARCDQRAGGE